MNKVLGVSGGESKCKSKNTHFRTKVQPLEYCQITAFYYIQCRQQSTPMPRGGNIWLCMTVLAHVKGGNNLTYWFAHDD